MRLAPICECKYPLIIEAEDWCSYCSRGTKPITDVPRVEDEYTPLELAEQMYAAGTGIDAIVAETGIGEMAILRKCDPERHRERSKAKNAKYTELKRARRWLKRNGRGEEDLALARETVRREAEESEQAFAEHMQRYAHLRQPRMAGGKLPTEVVLVIQKLLAERTSENRRRWNNRMVGEIVGCSGATVRALTAEGVVTTRLARAERREAKIAASREKALAELKEKYAAPLHGDDLRAAVSEIAAIKRENGWRMWTKNDIGEVLGIAPAEALRLLDAERWIRRKAEQKGVADRAA